MSLPTTDPTAHTSYTKTRQPRTIDITLPFSQIITTKENTDKWLDEAYKGCEQTHYKFVDEGSEQDGPMVMKRKRSRVILTPDEREEISNFLADNR